MIDIRNYKVVHKNRVYHGLTVRPDFPYIDGDITGKVIPAERLDVVAMDLHDGSIVNISDIASEFGFVKVG